MPNQSHFNFKAAILDMDGVITKTALVHAHAWKQLFDEFLKKHEGENYQPLNIETDYQECIDGIPRHDGIRNFLKSRSINIPEGKPEDGPNENTIYALGKKKNRLFHERLDQEGVEVYEDALEMIKKWKNKKIKLAVVSSSRNCEQVIEQARLTKYFEVRVDGITLEAENLKGKPEPDMFLKAAEYLHANIEETIVLEDAILGVKAGKRGEFGLVVGVARDGEKESLKEAGADIVVEKLTELVEN